MNVQLQFLFLYLICGCERLRYARATWRSCGVVFGFLKVEVLAEIPGLFKVEKHEMLWVKIIDGFNSSSSPLFIQGRTPGIFLSQIIFFWGGPHVFGPVVVISFCFLFATWFYPFLALFNPHGDALFLPVYLESCNILSECCLPFWVQPTSWCLFTKIYLTTLS